MRKLRIAQIAPLWFSIPPKKYGGTERIVSYLSEGLTKKGHRVTLFASGDSKTKAKLVCPLAKKAVMSAGGNWSHYWWNILNHSMAFERSKEFDIIHCHWDMMGTYFQRFVKTPVLHTLHNIPKPGSHFWKVFEHYQKDANLVFISKSERKNAKVKTKNSWVIYNGMDITDFKFNPRPKDHYVWVAKVAPEKGIENAIEIAKKTGIKLLMAGQIQPAKEEYFKTKIKPRLNSKIQYLGELASKRMPGFYSQAKALLYPIEWEEPFGLVMIEAMATGTPVIAFKRGSVPEVVKDGKTGFVVDTISEAIRTLNKIGQINREDCRKWVEDNFSLERMVDNYEKTYQEIIKKTL